MIKQFCLLLITIILVLFSCTKVQLIPSTSASIIEEIKKYKGKKVVLLNVWALWCVPCVEEFPMIVDLDKEIKDLEVIFISADFEDQIKKVESFLNDKGVGGKSYLKQEKDEPFIQRIHHSWTGSLPFTIVYAKDSGSIVDFWEGKEPESRFRTAINIAINS